MVCRGMKAILGVDPYQALLHSPRSPGSGAIPAFRAGTPWDPSRSLRSTHSAGLSVTAARAVARAGDAPDDASASDCGSDCGSSDFLEPLAAACERLPPSGPSIAALTLRGGGLPGMASMGPSASDTREPPQALVRDVAVELLRGMQTMAQLLTQRFGRRSPQAPVVEQLGATAPSPHGGTMASPAATVPDGGARPQRPGGSDCSSGSDDGSDSESPLQPLQHGEGSGWASRDEVAGPWALPGTGQMHGDSALEQGRDVPHQPMPGSIRRGMYAADTMRALRAVQPPLEDSTTPSRSVTPPPPPEAILAFLWTKNNASNSCNSCARGSSCMLVALAQDTCIIHSAQMRPIQGIRVL